MTPDLTRAPARQRAASARRSSARRFAGVFTAQLDDAYQVALWHGIERRAHERGLGIVCFVGHRIHSPVSSEAAANFTYDIADPRAMDGLIVVTSTIATFIGREQVEGLFSSRRGLPQVSVGLGLPGVPSVTTDGARAVSDMVRHLVRYHRRGRFALVGGPDGHPEAEDRERAFRRTLGELDIPFDERLATRGSFLRESGAAAAEELLRRGVPFDVLFCLNDQMALAAMEVLRRNGKRIPEDVAVTGFDGVEEGRYATPPLTTVTQPLDELGAGAVDLLLSLMDGETPPDRVLPCAIALRRSCGCPQRRSWDPDRVEAPDASEEERRAIDELVRLAREGDADAFIARLNRALDATIIAGDQPRKWNDYLSVVGRRAWPASGETGRGQLLEFARTLVGESESRRQAARRIAVEDRLATLRLIGSSLAGMFEMPRMFKRLAAGLARLGMGGGYLALFDGPGTGWSRLVMAPDGQGAQPLPPRGIRFRTVQLLPAQAGEAWRSGVWVLEPLVFQEERLGYMLLPGGAAEPAVYDMLPEQVTSAVKGALLLEQVRGHERHLEAEVERRTAELTRTNTELTLEIERRLRLEHEVSEISNRTMQKIGQDLHDDLCQHLAGIAMLASVLHGCLSGGDPSAVAAIEQISELLADSITRAKQIARGLYPSGLEERGIVAAVEDLVDTARRTHHVHIDFHATPDFRLPGTHEALQVYRIVQEALGNALKHSSSERIEVRLYREEAPGNGSRSHRLVAEVTDFGTGMPCQLPECGMGLRIMRYRAESAGAELRIDQLEPGTRVTCRLPSAHGGE